MPYELITTYLRLPVLLLVASRIGGMLMFQPLIGGYGIPRPVQILLILGLAALVTPLVKLEAGVPAHPARLMLALGGELLLGILIGLVVRMCFLGLQIGGQLIAQESGLALGEIVDPTTGDEHSSFGSLYLQLGAVIFLIVGGHRVLVAVALDTFDTIPLLCDPQALGPGLDLVFDALALGAEIGLRVAAPVLITLFLANAAMGFVSRTVPQFNVLTVGFSVKGLVVFVLMAVSLPAAFEAFTDALQTTVGWITELLEP